MTSNCLALTGSLTPLAFGGDKWGGELLTTNSQ